jgi:hypothetical protein
MSFLLIVVMTVCLVTARPVAAAPHRWVDEHGVVHFSNVAPRAADGSPAPAKPAPPSTPPPRREAAPPPAKVTPPSTTPDPRRAATPEPAKPAPPPRISEPRQETVSAPPESRPLATAPTGPRSSAVRELMERMHFRRAADLTARRSRELAFSQLFLARNPAAAWASVNAAFSSEAFMAFGVEYLERTLGDAETLPAMLAWLRSPLGRRVMDIGAEPPTPARDAELRRFTVKLPDTFSTDRIQLVREFGRASDFVPLSFDAMSVVDVAIMDLAARWRGEARPIAPPSVNEAVRWQIRIVTLFDCRELSDHELGEAIDFWKSPVGRSLTRAYREALLGAIAAAHARAAGIAPGRSRPDL